MPANLRADKLFLHNVPKGLGLNTQSRGWHSLLLAGLLFFCGFSAQAGTYSVFGPAIYQRAEGNPVAETAQFSVLDPSGEYYLNLYNGGIEDDEITGDLVSSGYVDVNGTRIVGNNNLNQSVNALKESLTLLATNDLEVEVRGKPGGLIAIEVIGIDDVPPTIQTSLNIPPNAVGWHKTDVVVSFECHDATSGIAEGGCPDPITVATEGQGQVITGTAQDRAGNTATASVALNIDKTPPTIIPSAVPLPNANSWNNTPVDVSFTCTDNLSGVVICPDPVNVSTEGQDQPVTGTIEDLAGNPVSVTHPVSIDTTPPTISPSAVPLPNANGWNNTPVDVSFSCSDNLSGVVACPDPVNVSTEGQDQPVTGAIADLAGNPASVTHPVSIDTTPPMVTPSAVPLPNANGWNNTPVDVSFTCSDNLSGVVACPDPVNVSTEGQDQPVTGAAEDLAGNPASAMHPVSIDTTPPTIEALGTPAPNANGWNLTDVIVSFTCTDNLSGYAGCPGPVTVVTEGAGQSVPGTVEDLAGNPAGTSISLDIDKTQPLLEILEPTAGSVVATNPPEIQLSFSDSNDIDTASLSFTDNGQPLPVQCVFADPGATCTPMAEMQGDSHAVSATISDIPGNNGTSADVPFSIVVDRDGDGYLDNVDAFPDDPNEWADTDGDGIGDNGDAFPSDPAEWSDLDGDGVGDNADTDRDNDGHDDNQDAFPEDPNEWADQDGDGIGDNSDPDRDGDGVANEEDFFPDDGNAWTVPTVTITSPATLTTFGASPIPVSGTIDDPDALLTLNGAPVEHSGGVFQANVAIEEGHNTIIARAVDQKGKEGTATISVSLDKTPPYITIESPLDGQVVQTSNIAVAGLINDIVRGTITDAQAQVMVNGIQATVANRSYLAEDVPLTEGENTITVTGSDNVGNTASTSITVTYNPPVGQHIELVGGQSQTETIRTVLPQPLQVKLVDDAGNPVVDKNVVFRVIQGDGVVAAGSIDEAQGALAKTDALGIASTVFKLGSRAGDGVHRVRAKAVGFDGEVVFYAHALSNPGDKVSVNSGNNQRGIVRQPLPQPFVVAVTDAGANLIEGASVEFKVTAGGGTFSNGEIYFHDTTDSDGRASAHLILGPEEGLDVQRVTATLVGTEASAGFTASGFMPGDPGSTSITGVVLDNQDNPLPSVTVRVDGTTRQGVTDEQGQFHITNVPVGPVHLLADPSTTTAEGEWPTLSYNIVTVPGVENPLSAPIYMVKLDTENAVYVGKEDAVITVPEVPGFKLEIKAGSVTFPDGAKEGFMSVTPVNASKVPMAPPNGMQPQLIVTIQPTGTRFDPPAPLTLPNVDGHLPGAQVEMYSYDHDLEEFVTIGLGTVSPDGSVIQSNIGVGVIKAGWHCGSQPEGNGCSYDCPYCAECDGNCSCVLVPDRPVEVQDPKDCRTNLCNNSWVPADETPEDYPCKECKDGKPTAIPDEISKKCGDGSPEQACLICIGGKCKSPDCNASNDKHTFTNTAPTFVLNALTNFSSTISSTPVFKATLKPKIDSSMEVGEHCCKNCIDIGPKPYKKFSGSVGLVGNVKATVPGLGGIYELPPKIFDGYALKATLFITFFGADIKVDAKGFVSYLETDCDGEDCGNFGLGTSLKAKIGPQYDGNIQFVSCTDPKCDKSASIVKIAVAGSGVANISAFIGGKWSSGAQCGKDCLGGKIDPITLTASLKVLFNIVFKQYTYSHTAELAVYDGGLFGEGLNCK